MNDAPKDQPSRDQLAELDREAWNLPAPQPAPVGPVREVWPVFESEQDTAGEKPLLEPAA